MQPAENVKVERPTRPDWLTNPWRHRYVNRHGEVFYAIVHEGWLYVTGDDFRWQTHTAALGDWMAMRGAPDWSTEFGVQIDPEEADWLRLVVRAGRR